MINLSDFFKELELTYKIISHSEDEKIYISSVSIGINDIISISKSVHTGNFLKSHSIILNYSNIKELLELDTNIELPGVIIFSEAFVLPDMMTKINSFIQSHTDISVVLVESNMKEENIYIKLNEYINEESNFIQKLLYDDYINLINLLNKSAEITNIEAIAYKLLKNPMIITDKSYKVIDYTKSLEINDPIWKIITSNKYCPSNIVNMTDYNRFWHRLTQNGRPLFVDSKAFSPYVKRAVAEIKSENRIEGYIALLEINKKITETDLQILQMISEVIAVKFTNNAMVSRALGDLENEFIKELFLGKIPNETMAFNQAQSLGWNIRKWFIVLEIRDRSESKNLSENLYSVKNEIRRLVPFCIYSFNDKKSYCIISFDDKKDLKNVYKELGEISTREQLICSAGNAVDRLILINKSYDQAKRTGEIVDCIPKIPSQKFFYLYNEIAIYDMMMNLNKMHPILGITSKSLSLLKKIDEKEGSEYIITLRNFFDNNQSISDTANAMYLHRNTISYRLNKIRKIIEDDFDNPLIRLHMYISFIIDDISI